NHIAKIYNVNSAIQARVYITEEISENSLFIPIHWNSATAKNSKPCLLINDVVDPTSGQPEFKHTPVNIKQWHYNSEALFITPHKIEMDNIEYWICEKANHGYLYRIASEQNTMALIIQLSSLLDNINKESKLTSELSHEYRYAIISNTKLHSAFIVSKKTTNEQKSWLLALYQHDEKDNIEASFHRH
ncbi:molybdopterin dinucleotide binding domain-containing protein, partial [Aliivibrio salmonicida]|uniref:molybdopterin dinucleotide binding domain-containing protein n=1 Tax=Aliivibrio salmonicida TaxID=40269 RepID=UPI0030A148D5